jgi:hypothetical protein
MFRACLKMQPTPAAENVFLKLKYRLHENLGKKMLAKYISKIVMGS